MLLPLLGNFAILSYLKEDFKLRLVIDVCTMFAGVLVSDSLLHMLPFAGVLVSDSLLHMLPC